MPVKTIVYLIVSVISVLIAVAMLIKIYNAFFGSNATEQDMQWLASTIERMANDDTPYERETFFFRISNDAVIGFDRVEASVKVAPLVIYDFPNECGNKPCLCRKDDVMDINNRAMIGCLSIKANKEISLATDYTGFSTSLGTKAVEGIPSSYLADLDQARYNVFVISNGVVQLIDQGIGTQANDAAKAVVPIVIEKILYRNKAYFFLMPDTTWSRGREFYLRFCPENSEEACKNREGLMDKTGYGSYTQFHEAGQQKYCAIDFFDNSCRVEDMPVCDDGSEIDGPCTCGPTGKAYISGICTNGIHSTLTCSIVNSCASYCTITGDNSCQATVDANGDNPKNEFSICSSNPCQQDTCILKRDGDEWDCETADVNGGYVKNIVDTISTLIDSNKQYETRTVSIPVRDTITGFDTNDGDITADFYASNRGTLVAPYWSGSLEEKTITKRFAPAICITEGTDEGLPDYCRMITTEETVTLYSDYGDYAAYDEGLHTAVDNIRPKQEGKPFIAHRSFIQYLGVPNAEFGVERQTTQVIMSDFIIDHIKLSDGSHQITIFPSSLKEIRSFMNRACPTTGEVRCRGKKGLDSFAEFGSNQYCEYDDNTKECSVQTLTQCTSGQHITSPCLCNAMLKTGGFCQ